MDKDVLKTIAGMCDNIEELIRTNKSKKSNYYQQKVILDLYMSVLNYQYYFAQNIGYKNGNEKI